MSAQISVCDTLDTRNATDVDVLQLEDGFSGSGVSPGGRGGAHLREYAFRGCFVGLRHAAHTWACLCVRWYVVRLCHRFGPEFVSALCKWYWANATEGRRDSRYLGRLFVHASTQALRDGVLGAVVRS